MAACLDQFDRWGVGRQLAGGELPVPGVYGVPEQWQHVRDLYRRSGFQPEVRAELVFLADVADLPVAADAALGLKVERSVGINGTRFSANLDGSRVGYLEVEIREGGERFGGRRSIAEIGSLYVEEGQRRQGVATWLLGQAADWLRLAHVERLLDYESAADLDCIAFVEHCGFRRLTCTERGWVRAVGSRGDRPRSA